jgi:hypothetical protein
VLILVQFSFFGVKFMQKLVADKDTLASMGGFAFMEGAVLFTAFAMIKSRI